MPSEHPKSFIEFVGTAQGITAEIIYPKDRNGKEKEPELVDIDEFIAVKGIKAMGNQLIKEKVKSINITIPEPVEETPVPEAAEKPSASDEFPEEGVIEELPFE